LNNINGIKYVLATANSGKITEMQKLLSDLNISIITRDDLGIKDEIEETGSTFFENAKIKADAICRISGLPSIADDSGLVVESLGGNPGVYSSSYGGDKLSAAERCLYLLKNMENMEQRNAKFVSVIVCVYPDGKLIEAIGECKGRITYKPEGTGGFGYDPVFKPEGLSKTMAELTTDEKNIISHRGIALRNFFSLLKTGSEGDCI